MSDYAKLGTGESNGMGGVGAIGCTWKKAREWAVVSSDDWWAVWVGLCFLGVAIGMSHVTSTPDLDAWSTHPWEAFNSPSAALIWIVLPLIGSATAVSFWVRGKSLDGFMLSFLLMAALTVLSKFLGSQKTMHASGMGAAEWAVLFGALISNVVFCGVKPPRFKAMLESGVEEYWIKVGLVLLAIDFQSVVRLGYHGFLLAWGETSIVLIVTYFFGTLVMKIDWKVAFITAAAVSVCGTSAASAVAAALAVPSGSPAVSVPIAIMTFMTVPCIPMVPRLGTALGFTDTQIGAWIGGSIDTTGAVVASASIAGPIALETAAVVKMLQNIIICFVALAAALVISRQTPTSTSTTTTTATSTTAMANTSTAITVLGADNHGNLATTNHSTPPPPPPPAQTTGVSLSEAAAASVAITKGLAHDKTLPTDQKPTSRGGGGGGEDGCCGCCGLLFNRFPKFAIGFLVTSLVLSFGVLESSRAAAGAWSFSLSEWFSTLGFVGIGLNFRLKELLCSTNPTTAAAKESQTALLSASVPPSGVSTLAVFALYSAGQLLDLTTTAVAAWLSFGHDAQS